MMPTIILQLLEETFQALAGVCGFEPQRPSSPRF